VSAAGGSPAPGDPAVADPADAPPPAATPSPFPGLEDLAAFVAEALGAAAFPPDERGGVFRPGDGRPLARVGVALEPWRGLAAWARRGRLDAVFLHRPWRLAAGALPDGVGVLWSHLPFDERLTTGFNPRLAEALGLAAPAPIGEKGGRPLGMMGDAAPAPAGAWAARVAAVFGGAEAALLPATRAPVARVAVVGAMTDALVREAAARGAGLYVTGQLRQPARRAAAETGVAVVAVGHARSEWWGARALAHLVAERWGAVRVAAADAGDGTTETAADTADASVA
jgi:putative NIF3 family GTP cyclohydrolase 1 type 2